MATADIYVDGVDGRPVQEKSVGSTVTLSNKDNTGVVSWKWELVFAPQGSTAAFSPSDDVASPTLGPLDVAGTYWVRLTVNGATGSWLTETEIDEIVVAVPAVGLPLYIPAVGETIQRGTQGWADEDKGLNKTLNLLASSLTLQGAYDNSTPPTITIDSAKGGVIIQRDSATPGDVISFGDLTNSHRVTIEDNGAVSILSADSTDPALKISLDSGVTSNPLEVYDDLSNNLLTLDHLGSLGINALSGASYGIQVNTDGAPLFLSENVGAANPATFEVHSNGSISVESDTPVTAFSINSWDPTKFASLSNTYLNSLGSVGKFEVLSHGSLYIEQTDAGLSDPSIRVSRFGGLLADLLLLTNDGDQVAVDYAGKIAIKQTLASSEVGIGADYNAVVYDAYLLNLTDALSVSGDGSVYQNIEQHATNPNASAEWFTIDGTSADLGAGKDRIGIHVNTSGNIASGSFVGAQVSVDGSGAGSTTGFKVTTKDQDGTEGYVVDNSGAGFVGYDTFCAADVQALWGSWLLNLSAVSGAATRLSSGDAKDELIVPLHIPPGTTLEEVTVHVNAAASGATLTVLKLDGTKGASAETQTQLGQTVSASAGSQDITVVVNYAVPKHGGSVSDLPALFIHYKVSDVGDAFYGGQAKFTYSELLLGD